MSEKTKKATRLCGLMFLAALVVGLAVQPLSAQVTIPEGSTITSATFHIYVYAERPATVNLYRITGEWAETIVTYNSFGNSYAPDIEGTFDASTTGWKEVTITSLVQAWVLGTYPNYGIVLAEPTQQPSDAFAYYYSSEYTPTQSPIDPSYRPFLVINYTPPGGSPTSVTIRRPGVLAEQVVDTALNPTQPTLNFGTEEWLATRYFNNTSKYSLVRFIFSFTPPPPPPDDCPGTGTPGYWMNHPEAWPVENISIGGITYQKADAILLMQAPVAKDKTYTMFAALVAAKLNAALGCTVVCPTADIGATITSADAWMSLYPAGSDVRAGGPTSPWRVGEPLYYLLDQYNNGLLCVPHRD